MKIFEVFMLCDDGAWCQQIPVRYHQTLSGAETFLLEVEYLQDEVSKKGHDACKEKISKFIADHNLTIDSYGIMNEFYCRERNLYE